jgi:hypothetical protein
MIGGGWAVALQESGVKITQVAAYPSRDGGWVVQELKEPTDGQITPLLSGNLAAYAIGHHVYAFTADSGRWDVLDLAEGAEPQPVLSHQHISVESGGRLFVFSANRGRWDEVKGLDDEEKP